jgi:hypothetical protein
VAEGDKDVDADVTADATTDRDDGDATWPVLSDLDLQVCLTGSAILGRPAPPVSAASDA